MDSDILEAGVRDELSSICRETAKSLDMSRNGSRWRCEVTKVQVLNLGVKEYSFYIHDKNSGHEYQAQSVVENNKTADWKIQLVDF